MLINLFVYIEESRIERLEKIYKKMTRKDLSEKKMLRKKLENRGGWIFLNVEEIDLFDKNKEEYLKRIPTNLVKGKWKNEKEYLECHK